MTRLCTFSQVIKTLVAANIVFPLIWCILVSVFRGHLARKVYRKEKERRRLEEEERLRKELFLKKCIYIHIFYYLYSLLFAIHSKLLSFHLFSPILFIFFIRSLVLQKKREEEEKRALAYQNAQATKIQAGKKVKQYCRSMFWFLGYSYDNSLIHIVIFF